MNRGSDLLLKHEALARLDAETRSTGPARLNTETRPNAEIRKKSTTAVRCSLHVHVYIIMTSFSIERVPQYHACLRATEYGAKAAVTSHISAQDGTCYRARCLASTRNQTE